MSSDDVVEIREGNGYSVTHKDASSGRTIKNIGIFDELSKAFQAAYTFIRIENDEGTPVEYGVQFIPTARESLEIL